MAITIIKGPEGIRTVFSAYGTITQLRSLQFISGEAKLVGEAMSGYPSRAAGVAAETAVSGDLIRAITHGLASGVICASSVIPGQGLQLVAASGLISGTGHIGPLLSGTYDGRMLGKAAMSGGRGSGIAALIDLG
ncbi:unnamed protein product [marine sediment metagenome]|uniref:Uncharacterized protein n=3 Tax=marine sediment metagenome TaxID=412755 RepID=X1DH90_9ZZZZ